MLGSCSTEIDSSLGQHHGKQFQIMAFVSLSQTCDWIGLNSNRRHSPIHILNNDVLLHVFHLYLLAEPDGYDDESGLIIYWSRRRWWYKLAHVCRLWRNLILESPSRLDLHLLCTNGVPVADMLAHSPPLPLTIDYDWKMRAEDESGILFALSHRDRVHRIYFRSLPNVGKFVTVMDDQFPILERIYIDSWAEDVALPVTFQAPNLRQLKLVRASLPIGSPLLVTSVALVTLSLFNIPPFVYFPPSYLLTRLSLMAQLESLVITFNDPHPNRDVEMELRQTLSIAQVTLTNLRRFQFDGAATYLEGLVARISAPSLSIFRVYLHNQLSAGPCLLQFIRASENLRFSAVRLSFGALNVYLHGVTRREGVTHREWDTSLMLGTNCKHLDLQVAYVMQFFGTLSPMISIVEQVTVNYEKHIYSSQSHNNVDRRQWRDLLRPFTNAKTIHVQDGLVSKIFGSLPSDDGESPLELLPNLEEVGYLGGTDAARDAFTTFLNERQVAGHPVSLRLVDRSMFDDPKGWYTL